mmetsp:Transcript_7136/g.14575  ORF Transcript_7136/g.14575 Transcript_7136/m.14575 type:complete len:81 (-) Transcript_7136:36-278(-)
MLQSRPHLALRRVQLLLLPSGSYPYPLADPSTLAVIKVGSWSFDEAPEAIGKWVAFRRAFRNTLPNATNDAVFPNASKIC